MERGSKTTGGCAWRWPPRRGLTALLRDPPPATFPRTLLSSLAAGISFPVSWGLELEAFPTCCTHPLSSPGPWGPSVLRARFTPTAVGSNPPSRIAPSGAPCVPCAPRVRAALMPFLVTTLGVASAPEAGASRGEPALSRRIFHGTCVARVQSVCVLVIPNLRFRDCFML